MIVKLVDLCVRCVYVCVRVRVCVCVYVSVCGPNTCIAFKGKNYTLSHVHTHAYTDLSITE